ncbi:MAG: enolase C-terminal domain-like protein [Thermoleophilaceae bacterium]
MAVATRPGVQATVERLEVAAYTIPLEEPESDGTLEWDSLTCVVVHAHAGGQAGLGYTYGADSIAHFIRSKLADQVEGADALSPQAAWARMERAIRNFGQQGLGAMAMSAVEIALWDLKARLVGLAFADLLGRFHEEVPIYGSGGFTSYSDTRLREQLAGWVHELRIPRVKVKVGRQPERDPARLRAARQEIGDRVELFVDANGAFDRKQALYWSERYAELGVSYLEEPVSSQDRQGLRLLRDRAPAGLAIAAGEYEWGLPGLHELADCVDVLQADITRCGVSNVLRADGICRSRSLPFSAHCAPAVSAHVCAAMECARHIEYFHDHARAEQLLFDGVLDPRGGALRPDASRPGLGIELKRADVARYEA